MSDIDVLFVVEAPLGRAAKEGSVRVVSQHFDGRGAGLDLRVATETMDAAPERLPAIDLEIGVHAPQYVASIVADNSTDPDLLIELAVSRAYGESLRGLAVSEVIAPVPERWLLEVGAEEVRRWQKLGDHSGSEISVTLTACRIWRYAEERLFCSKAQAASWAIERAPDCLAIEQAMRLQQGLSEDPVDQETIPPLLTRVRHAVEEALRE